VEMGRDEKALGQELLDWRWVVIAGWTGLFAYSVVLTIYDDHQDLVRAAASGSGLHAEIFSRFAYKAEDKEVLEIVAVELHNTGVPTSVRGWVLEVTTPDKRKHRGLNRRLPDTITIQQKNSAPLVYHASDSIFEQAFREPIQQGKILSGVLLVSFDDVTEPELSDERTQFKLMFTDISYKSHDAVNKAMTKGTITAIPGLGPQ